MSPMVKAYLDTLYEQLRILPEQDRLESVREIESHIIDGIRNGKKEADIVEKLGDPKLLAKAYRSEHIMQRGGTRSIRDVLTMIGFYCITGLLSVIIVPVLATIAYGFGFSAVLVFVAGIVRSFGVTWIQMDLGPKYTVPIEWSMAYAIMVGGIIGWIAYISNKYLKKYIMFVQKHYRTLLPKMNVNNLR
ncbi:DUF1700 domain-containing protein [Brevibacillus sp. SIMBA_040]|uniref:DUF1700 domain-containing protein n=1 Tax=unclassified Brevibacillus TaxID=2684853 RepID=UPI00397A9798